MNYTVSLTDDAEAQLAALPKKIQGQIARKIDRLTHSPTPPGARRLVGTDGLYRLRAGHYRIVYHVAGTALLILVVRIAHRKDVYRRLPT